MEKVYVVCFASGWSDDRYQVETYSNVHGVYSSLEKAKQGLVECKDEIYNEEVGDTDGYTEEEIKELKENVQVYGSVKEGYFEVDNHNYDVVSEVHISIVEKEII